MKRFLTILGITLLEILILSGIAYVNVQLTKLDFTFLNIFAFISLFVFGIASIGFCLILILLIVDHD